MSSEFDEFVLYINSHNKFIKTGFIRNLPLWLGNKNCESRQEYLKKLPSIFDKEKAVKFLKIQTAGRDYAHFDVICSYYNLEYDDNNMMIFNEKISVDEVKPEPLFIWWILKLINTDPFIGKHRNYLTFKLQDNFGNSICPMFKKDMKIDMLFDKLDIIVEIDENHHLSKRQQVKDDEKDAKAQTYGFACIRLKFYNITKEAKNKKISMNEAIRNSPVLKEFKNDFLCLVRQSLKQYSDVRQDFILFKLKNVLCEEIHSGFTNIEKYQQRITELRDKLKQNNCKKDQKKLTLLENRCEKLLNHVELKNSIFQNMHESEETATNIFTYIHRHKEGEKYVITLEELMWLLGDNANSSKNYLKDIGLIDIDGNFEGRILTWRGLKSAIFNWDHNEYVKKTLCMYCEIIEDSYEEIIQEYQLFVNKSKSSQKTGQIFEKYVESRVTTYRDDENSRLKYDYNFLLNKYNILEKEVEKLRSIVYCKPKKRPNTEVEDFILPKYDVYENERQLRQLMKNMRLLKLESSKSEDSD